MKFHMQERGEHIPPEGSFDVARRIKEMHCYTSADIVKVLITSTDFFFTLCSYLLGPEAVWDYIGQYIR
jgi:hypothetical protein